MNANQSEKGFFPKTSYREMQEADSIFKDANKKVAKMAKNKECLSWLHSTPAHHVMFRYYCPLEGRRSRSKGARILCNSYGLEGRKDPHGESTQCLLLTCLFWRKRLAEVEEKEKLSGRKSVLRPCYSSLKHRLHKKTCIRYFGNGKSQVQRAKIRVL